nr:L-threonylcarbamoyladenylate synthase [Paenibacillus sp. HB172176]
MTTDTRIWQMNDEDAHRNEELLREAADVIREGGTVAFPTETVYGLGADARNSKAVETIFRAKGRPSDNPLIVHIADPAQLRELVRPYPPLAAALMARFWPGALTIVLPLLETVANGPVSKETVPAEADEAVGDDLLPHHCAAVSSPPLSPLVTAGLRTVGVRIPSHPIALQFLKLADCPVAGPSANRSGRPSPTLAEHVSLDLGGRIDGIIDGGASGLGLESTVIELEDEETIRILRPGGVGKNELRQAFPHVRVLTAEDSGPHELREAPRSPGMKYTHYAPKGELTLVKGGAERMQAYIQKQIDEANFAGLKTGVLAFSEHVSGYRADMVLDFGSELRLDQAARRLYAALRQFDAEEVSRIWAEASQGDGIGEALENRMLKASGYRVVQV